MHSSCAKLGMWVYIVVVVTASYAGLNKRTTSNGLKEAFSKFGQVIEGIYWIIAQPFLQLLIPYIDVMKQHCVCSKSNHW